MCGEIGVPRLLARFGSSLTLATALIAAASSAARSQSSAPADNTKIVIGEGSTGTSLIPLYVALQEGLFKKAGVDATAQMLSGGTPAAVASFAAGSVNIVNFSGPELVQYTGSKAISGKAFGEITDQTYDIVASKTITSFQDIKGKIVGVSALNAGDYIYFLALMQHYGISPNDVTFVTGGNPVSRLAALTAGAIQVTAATNSQHDQSSKVGVVLLKSSDSPVQFPGNVFIANSDLINNHKPLLKKFVGALAEATSWVQANPAAAAAICAKTLATTIELCAGTIALNFDRSITSKFTWSSTYAVNIEGIKSSLAVMATIQPDTQSLTVDDVTDISIAGMAP